MNNLIISERNKNVSIFPTTIQRYVTQSCSGKFTRLPLSKVIFIVKQTIHFLVMHPKLTYNAGQNGLGKLLPIEQILYYLATTDTALRKKLPKGTSSFTVVAYATLDIHLRDSWSIVTIT